MEAGTAVVESTTEPQHMTALAKAVRRKKEMAQLKRDVAAGRLSAVKALDDPRAVGTVTVGMILLAQRHWGRQRTSRFLLGIGAPPSAFAKRVEALTDRQRGVIVQALTIPQSAPTPLLRW